MSNLLKTIGRRKKLKENSIENHFQHGCFLKKIRPLSVLWISLVFMLGIGMHSIAFAQMKAEDYALGDIQIDAATFQKYYKNYLDKVIDALPASYDARTTGIVSMPKNQGSCGSCWAFATVGAMESHIKKTYSAHLLYDLSEQQQVSCNTSMLGCTGGSSTAPLFWESKGPNLETDYPYSSGGGSVPPCIPGYSELNYRVYNFYTTSGTENYKASLYDKGPSYWRFNVHTDFLTWWDTATSGSVYTNASLAFQGGHAVLLIGWDDAKGAFLCKNSWGATGGPNGDGTFWIAYSGHANDLGFGMCNFDVTYTGGTTGMISGRVTNTSAVGIQNINVQVVNLDGSSVTSVDTDASGNYMITALPAGNFKVFFYKNGLNYLSEWYNDKASFATADQVAVTAGGTTPNINAQLATGGQISGRVTNTSAVGIQNITVYVYDLDYKAVEGASTDASGNYTVLALPAGTFRVIFSPPNGSSLNYLYEWYNDKNSFTTADPVAVTAGSTTPNINAQLATGGQISGRVTNVSTVGIQNIAVYLYSGPGGGLDPAITDSWEQAVTDANGNYTFSRLPTGIYTVWFHNDGLNYASEWYNDKGNIATADPVAVTAGSTTASINAVLAAGGSISGRVTDSSLAGIQGVGVYVCDLNNNRMGSGYTDSSGNYTVSGLPAGNLKVRFTYGTYATEWYNDKSSFARADPVAVTSGNTTENINAQLVAGGIISGRVTDVSGSGFNNIIINIYDLENQLLGHTHTDTNGNYSVQGLPGGNYKVFFANNGYAVPSEWYNDKNSFDTADPVTVTAGNTTPDINAQLVATRVDFIGTWDSQGVYYRNSLTGLWVKLATPATLVTAGDLDGDGIDDLIGIWPGQGGVWVKYSLSGSWAQLSSTARDISAGDMNGDGRDDLVATWDGQGVYYRNSIGGAWVKMATPATQVTAGDLDGDGKDDVIGIWPSQGGVWVKYSQSGAWAQLSTTAVDIAAGDMNGDGRDDLMATWDGQGVYYRNSISGAWVKMATPATLVAAGDLDGDGKADVIGIWPGQGGVWVKYSQSGSWAQLSTTARHIAAGLMRGGAGSSTALLAEPFGGVAAGPENLGYQDMAAAGPSDWNFQCQEEKNLTPQQDVESELQRVPGPGEYGFQCLEQKNLVPGKEIKKEPKDKEQHHKQ